MDRAELERVLSNGSLSPEVEEALDFMLTHLNGAEPS
jgi:hypothetical protein